MMVGLNLRSTHSASMVGQGRCCFDETLLIGRTCPSCERIFEVDGDTVGWIGKRQDRM